MIERRKDKRKKKFKKCVFKIISMLYDFKFIYNKIKHFY